MDATEADSRCSARVFRRRFVCQPSPELIKLSTSPANTAAQGFGRPRAGPQPGASFQLRAASPRACANGARISVRWRSLLQCAKLQSDSWIIVRQAGAPSPLATSLPAAAPPMRSCHESPTHLVCALASLCVCVCGCESWLQSACAWTCAHCSQPCAAA